MRIFNHKVSDKIIYKANKLIRLYGPYMAYQYAVFKSDLVNPSRNDKKLLFTIVALGGLKK